MGLMVSYLNFCTCEKNQTAPLTTRYFLDKVRDLTGVNISLSLIKLGDCSMQFSLMGKNIRFIGCRLTIKKQSGGVGYVRDYGIKLLSMR